MRASLDVVSSVDFVFERVHLSHEKLETSMHATDARLEEIDVLGVLGEPALVLEPPAIGLGDQMLLRVQVRILFEKAEDRVLDFGAFAREGEGDVNARRPPNPENPVLDGQFADKLRPRAPRVHFECKKCGS